MKIGFLLLLGLSWSCSLAGAEPPKAQAVPPSRLPQVTPPRVLQKLPRITPPGAYLAVSHSAVVVVPAPHPDDRAVIKPKSFASAMPVISPELKLVPLPWR